MLLALLQSQALLASFVREAPTLAGKREQPLGSFIQPHPPLYNRVLRGCGGPQVEPSQLISEVGVHPASPLVGAFYSFIRTLLPRMLHWSTDSWLLKVTVAQDQRMQKRFLDSVKEEGLKN